MCVPRCRYEHSYGLNVIGTYRLRSTSPLRQPMAVIAFDSIVASYSDMAIGTTLLDANTILGTDLQNWEMKKCGSKSEGKNELGDQKDENRKYIYRISANL